MSTLTLPSVSAIATLVCGLALAVLVGPGAAVGQSPPRPRAEQPGPHSCVSALCRGSAAEARLTALYRRCVKSAEASLARARACGEQELARQQKTMARLQARAEQRDASEGATGPRDVQARWLKGRAAVCASVASDFGWGNPERWAWVEVQCRMHVTAGRVAELEHDLAL